MCLSSHEFPKQSAPFDVLFLFLNLFLVIQAYSNVSYFILNILSKEETKGEQLKKTM